MPRKNLFNAYSAYRKNPLDTDQRGAVIQILVDRVDLTEAQANKVADRIDQQLEAAGYDELPSVDYFNQIFRGIVKKIVALKKEKEEREPDFEPAVDYPKPVLYKGQIKEAMQAINALSFMVDVLHDEGPVKGGGAAQTAQKERSNSRRRASLSSRRRSTRRNPYRAAAPVRGYRTNPFLPSDQDPLSIYRARLNRPGKAPLTSLEHLRAARLLRSHVKGMQAKPDFDSAQINTIVAILTGTAIDENEAGKYGWKVPQEDQRLGPNDYLIVHPESGSVQFEVKGDIEGLFVWKWDGGDHFEIQFPHYDDPDENESDEKTVESKATLKNLRLAPPGEKGVSKKQLLNVYRFADKMKDRGYSVKAVDRPRGQYIGLALRCETSAGKEVAIAFIEAGKTLSNKSMIEFGARLGVAWRSWASVGDSNVRLGQPSGILTGKLSASDVEKVSSFFSALQRERVPIEELAAKVQNNAEYAVGQSGGVVSDSLIGAVGVIDAVRGKVERIIGIPQETPNHPVKYIYKAKPGDVVVSLPGSCLPFLVAMEGNGQTCDIYLGVKATKSDATRSDALDFRSAFLYKSKIPYSSSKLVWPRLDRRMVKSTKGSAIKYKLSGSNVKSAATVDWNSVARISIPNLEYFLQGLQNMVTGVDRLNDKQYFTLFSGKFYELDQSYSNTPKVFTVYSDVGYLFIPLMVALYRGMMGKTVAQRADTDSFGNTTFTLALSEASPTPFIADNQPVPVGAGRIDSSVVKSLATGRKITAPGLDPELKKAIKTLLPPPSFQYRFTETVAGKVGEAAKKVRRSFKPYPYQKIGIAFIHAAMGRAMIGDEMGLGKTIQALGALSLDPSPTTGQSMLPALIICPPTVMGSWAKECKRWLPHLSVAPEVKKKPQKADISIMSWGVVKDAWETNEGRYNTIIVDEAHYGKRLLKNTGRKAAPDIRDVYAGNFQRSGKGTPFTMRTFGFVRMCQSAPHAILLSGTLMENGGKDAENLWTYLHALDPDRFASNRSFIKQNFSDGKLIDVTKFRQDFNQYHIRRMKSTVGEQVNLGCLYDPSYGASDPGCAGSEDEIEVITVEGADPRSNRRSRKPRRKPRRNRRRMRRNASSGYLRVGKTKRIIKGYLEFTEQQKEIYKSIDAGMIEKIKQAKRDRAIDRAIKTITKGGKPDLTRLPQVVSNINVDLSEEDPRKIAKVAIAVYHYLRESVGQLKIPNAIEWVANSVFIDKEPCIVWVDQRKVAKEIAAGLDAAQKGGSRIKYAMVIGGVPAKTRTQIVDDFQEGKIDVIIASRAMKEGVTLTRCNRALFAEMWWVGAWMSQAEDRIFRIGQERDCVIEYLLAPGTIDDAMWDKVAAKKATQSMVFGSEEFKQGTEDVSADNVAEATNMSEKEREEFNQQVKEELAKIQEDIDSGELSAEDQKEAVDEAERLEGQNLIVEVTVKIMDQMLEEARQREIDSANTAIYITEQEVYDKIMEMGLKEVSYSLTRKGVNWADEYLLKKSYSDALADLGKLNFVSITAARRDALAALEEMQKEGIKATTKAIKESYENGTRLVKALIGLIESPNRKVRETLTYKGGVALNTNQQAMLEAMQEIAGTRTTDKLSIPQILQVANRNLEYIGRKSKYTVSPVKKALKGLVENGLVTKEEKALDFRQNSRKNTLSARAVRNLMSKPIPSNLQRAFKKNASKYGYNIVQNKASDLAVNLPLVPVNQSVVAYNELADLMEQIEESGGAVPEHIEKIAANAYRTLSKLYTS